MNAEAPINYFDTSPEAQSARASRRLGKRGSRAKLAEKALHDLCQVWDEQGIEAVRRMSFHDPSGFVKTVAALLPQKIEHTFPTDGLSDDRLADLLEIADTMAKRLGLTDENRLIDVTPEGPGRGPDRDGDAAGEGCPSTPRSAENPETSPPSNGLNDTSALREQDCDNQNAEAAPTSTADRLIAEESDYAMQPPVGRPFEPLEHDEKRDNLRKLNDEDPIDPASLF